MKPKVYLDMCAIQRPLDTQNQIRIVLESEAVLGILTLCEEGKIEILSSAALLYEARRNPWVIRKEYAMAVLDMARNHVGLGQEARARAAYFVQCGFKPLDALHLALAEAGEAQYFCTCDDRLLKRAKRCRTLRVIVLSPVELIKELER